ncbi:DUF1737 domain-containing protein [Maribacter cobaltidurans]|uniref:Uncharacterized protein n=1 Tax=Maribacter cobaltidurans TaxID=1178778 RepID=A0A223V107_9FLAO|nr:DUF1737 domain-containing protein [Maribacter cobaltidurans]ASV29004.1 hypothetical protein CJ263_01470 [Maribacter cobaltidurans]GGD72789.1 hypothetical protein GCM10011412_08000 [Maribacter cobaltidurans]
MAYKILYASSSDSLEKEMVRHLNDYWEPLGGVAIGNFEGGVHFYQAVVRRDLIKFN